MAVKRRHGTKAAQLPFEQADMGLGRIGPHASCLEVRSSRFVLCLLLVQCCRQALKLLLELLGLLTVSLGCLHT